MKSISSCKSHTISPRICSPNYCSQKCCNCDNTNTAIKRMEKLTLNIMTEIKKIDRTYDKNPGTIANLHLILNFIKNKRKSETNNKVTQKEICYPYKKQCLSSKVFSPRLKQSKISLNTAKKSAMKDYIIEGINK